MNKFTRSLLTVIGIILFALQPAHAQGSAPLAVHLTADGAISPAMEEYISRGIEIAERRGAELVILQLNTPGGAIDTMNLIVQRIRASRVPVVVYVAPRGAMAGSAGTVITLAGHASAMAPETAIGAASPVGGQGEDLGDTIEAKQKEILKATVRSLAERRGSEAIQIAEDTIETARAVSSSEAKNAGLVDFIASDLNDLLRQLDGFEVEIEQGSRKLSTANAIIEPVSLSLIEQLLLMLTNPNIVFLLLTIGVQAIFIELSSPGGWVAGFIGAVCLALAFYGLGVLPVNWFGLIFLAIAFVLFILEVKAPTQGALTAAGIISFIVGALVLFNSPGTPDFQRVSLPLVIGTGMLTGLLFATIVGFAIRALRVPIRTGQESFSGRTGMAKTDINPVGQVQAGSELWTAELVDGSDPITRGERVEIIAVEGLRLKIRKMKP